MVGIQNIDAVVLDPSLSITSGLDFAHWWARADAKPTLLRSALDIYGF